MIFNSVEFLIFFPVVVLVYYIIPQKVRYLWLLAASYYFYMSWNPVYICLLLICTVVTYLLGRVLEKYKNADSCINRKIYLAAGLVILLGILGYFKYFDFMLLNLNRILSLFSVQPVMISYSVALPVGISFYTLQALGYLIDVYRGDIYAEKNFFRYALFLAFFPQLVAGPIERSKNLLVQLYRTQKAKWEDFSKGVFWMLWGVFLKLVIADRAAVIVNTVYENSTVYPGFFIVVATFFFSIQIYCDFCGYSTIAKGAALVLGIRLLDNFNAPYLSRSVKEFWRRWHISLSGWFRDYLYIPLGGNKKGWMRKQVNLLFVFAVSGLWHGAAVAFVVWGILNGLYQILRDSMEQIKEKFCMKENFIRKAKKKADTFSRRMVQRVVTFILISFTWIFFRAGDMSDAIVVIKNMCHLNWMVLFDGSLYQLGVGKEYFYILLAAILSLFYVDHRKYKGTELAEMLMWQEWWFRAVVYVGLFASILMFGCYGVEYDTNEFIYFQF